MQGKEIAYCNLGLKVITGAILELMNIPVEEALSRVNYGKGDTLGLDAIPELSILDGVNMFDNMAVVITEETDKFTAPQWNDSSNPKDQYFTLFSDPTDRSKFLQYFLQKLANENLGKKIGELLEEKNAAEFWENLDWLNKYNEKPAKITGATTAITCIYQGKVIFTVIGNYITQTIYLACQAGIYEFQLPSYNDRERFSQIDLDLVIEAGKTISFPTAASICKTATDYRRFVTFLGKSGYAENLAASNIFCNATEKFLHHPEPGGPSRILYLSNLQKDHGPIGFILYNGEKIGEWIHSLAFVKWAKNNHGNPALKLFEISTQNAMFKEGILMSNTEAYSFFRFSDMYGKYLDLSRLQPFKTPSHFRSMLLATQADNRDINNLMYKNSYREVSGCL